MTKNENPTPSSKVVGSVTIPKSALNWLFGEGPDVDGNWFDKPEGAPAFWWRDHFQKLIAKEAYHV